MVEDTGCMISVLKIVAGMNFLIYLLLGKELIYLKTYFMGHVDLWISLNNIS